MIVLLFQMINKFIHICVNIVSYTRHNILLQIASFGKSKVSDESTSGTSIDQQS